MKADSVPTVSEHTVFLIGGDDDETATISTRTESGCCHLQLSYRGRIIDAQAGDYFEALCRARRELEHEKLIPFCYGASLNVYPSGMARDMGAGLKAYRLTIGQHTRSQDLVDIFAQGPDVIPAYVSAQREFFERWVAEIRARK